MRGFMTFVGLAVAPHAITNLAEVLGLVDRVQDALAGEMHRRQEMLRAAGIVAKIATMSARRARRGGTRQVRTQPSAGGRLTYLLNNATRSFYLMCK